MSQLAAYKKKAERVESELRMAQLTAAQETAALAVAKESVDNLLEAQQVVAHIAQTIQQQVHGRVSQIVTRCLNAVFEDPYEFKIRFDRKRGKTEARMVLIRDGEELDDPLNEVGGGVVDVVSLALRLAHLLLSRPPRRRLVVLDEPFSAIRGAGNKQRTQGMLLKLAEELGFQFVLNTEIPAYQMGTVVELSR